MSDQIKVAVSIAEMARVVGLSRQRFHQPIGTAFPFPIYSHRHSSPILPGGSAATLRRGAAAELRGRWQSDSVLPEGAACRSASQDQVGARKETKKDEHPELLAAVRALGLVSATVEQISAAAKSLFPDGVGRTWTRGR